MSSDFLFTKPSILLVSAFNKLKYKSISLLKVFPLQKAFLIITILSPKVSLYFGMLIPFGEFFSSGKQCVQVSGKSYAHFENVDTHSGNLISFLELRIDNLKMRVDNLKLRIDNLKMCVDNLKMLIDNLKLCIDNLKMRVDILKMCIDNWEMFIRICRISIIKQQKRKARSFYVPFKLNIYMRIPSEEAKNKIRMCISFNSRKLLNPTK